LLATQAQFAGPDGAMFWHLPGFRSDVVQAALSHSLPSAFAAHGPAATTPTRCKRPGNPDNLAQVPAYDAAVNTVGIAATATNSTSDEERDRFILCSVYGARRRAVNHVNR
jgi:hypothetical protein